VQIMSTWNVQNPVYPPQDACEIGKRGLITPLHAYRAHFPGWDQRKMGSVSVLLSYFQSCFTLAIPSSNECVLA
jgi:hypothetical protein